MSEERKRFKHAIESLESEELRLKGLIKCAEMRGKYDYMNGGLNTWKLELSEVEDALIKLRNHSMTDRM